MSENGNGTGKFILEKELWMWRGLLIFLLLMDLTVTTITFIVDRGQHASDNAARAGVWQYLKDRTDGNRAMISKNHDAILLVDDHLRQCMGCHAHPNMKWKKAE